MKVLICVVVACAIVALAAANMKGADGVRDYLDYSMDPSYQSNEIAAGCSVPGVGSGTCESTSSKCDGHFYAGHCPGPSNIQCCVKGNAGGGNWTREECMKVAKAWHNNKIRYSWSPTTKQHVKFGKGLYRSDCSGFVTAAWNFDPPGAVVDTMPGYNIDAKELKTCDALKHEGTGGNGHVALFVEWKGNNPVVVEECGHTSECCEGEATCPGKCGSASKCDEYCPGCPIQWREWSDGLRGFQPIRRKGW